MTLWILIILPIVQQHEGIINVLLMLHNYTLNVTVYVRQLNDEWVRNTGTTRWKWGCKEGLRRSWPNAQHCTCTDGREKGRGGREGGLKEGGGVDKDWWAQSVQGRHNPSLEESRANQVPDFTTFAFSSTTGTETPSCHSDGLFVYTGMCFLVTYYH